MPAAAAAEAGAAAAAEAGAAAAAAAAGAGAAGQHNAGMIAAAALVMSRCRLPATNERGSAAWDGWCHAATGTTHRYTTLVADGRGRAQLVNRIGFRYVDCFTLNDCLKTSIPLFEFCSLFLCQ